MRNGRDYGLSLCSLFLFFILYSFYSVMKKKKKKIKSSPSNIRFLFPLVDRENALSPHWLTLKSLSL